jgi:hypothetical protein
MDIVHLAEASGLMVMLEGRIGREEYHSFYGSLSALQRFADAVRLETFDGLIDASAGFSVPSTKVSS